MWFTLSTVHCKTIYNVITIGLIGVPLSCQGAARYIDCATDLVNSNERNDNKETQF